MLRGLNDNLDVGGPLFFNLSLPNRLTTTSDCAALSPKQILCFYFMKRIKCDMTHRITRLNSFKILLSPRAQES